MTDYIRDKSIFLSNLYYDCNIVGCKCKEAVLSFMGNNYCMKHFIEFIREDKEKEDIKKFLEDLKRLPDSKASFKLIEKWEEKNES